MILKPDEFAATILQADFVRKGRDYAHVDCWGVVFLGYRDVLGINLPSYVEDYEAEDVSGTKHLDGLISSHLHEWEEVDKPELMDVTLFRLSGQLWHVGLIIDTKIKMVLHAEERLGVFVERLESPMWAKRLEGIYRYVG